MELIKSKDINDYSILLDGLYPDFGNHFCHTILCWCDLMEKGIQPNMNEGNYWELWIVKDHRYTTQGICGLYSLSPSLDTLWLGWLGVLPHFRNKQVGSYIIDQLKFKAKNLGAKELMSYVDEEAKPLNFYYRHGFGVVDKVGNYVRENNLSMANFESENDFIIQITL